MEGRVKLFGHPAQPVFVVYPIGLFSVVAIFDILFLAFDNTTLPTVSFYIIAAGVVGGLLTGTYNRRLDGE
jgi:uncharacterized membrane protein